jgi:hypothetical protein
LILTLCGSHRFEPYWHEANKQLTLAGHVCFSTSTFPSVEGAKTWYTDDQKRLLDLAHLAKIEHSAAVVMLNIDGYLGESSLRELQWARLRNKEVYWVWDDTRMLLGSERWARELILQDPDRFSGALCYWVELLDAVQNRQQDKVLNGS